MKQLIDTLVDGLVRLAVMACVIACVTVWLMPFVTAATDRPSLYPPEDPPITYRAPPPQSG